MFLLDTNVVSEMRRPLPDPNVSAWFENQPRNAHFISVISLTELTQGAAGHPDPIQRHTIRRWIDEVLRIWFQRQILDVTAGIAEQAGQLLGSRRLDGRPLTLADALIAATAIDHPLTLVTRNVRDFVDLPLDVYDPWTDKPISGSERP